MHKKVGFIAIFLIVVFFIYSLIGQILETLKSGDRLSQSAIELVKLQVKNKELKDRLSQIKSSSFVEQQARDKLGLAKPGETVVVIPQEVLDKVLRVNKKIEEIKLPNWLGWWKVFFK